MFIFSRQNCRLSTHSTVQKPKNREKRAGIRLSKVFICALFLVFSINAQTTRPRDKHDADRAAIRADIEAITQAYLDGDVEKIYTTHSKDWTGFLGRARRPIIGVDEYMKFQGLRYPPPADAPKPKPDTIPNPTIFRTTDFDVNFVTPDVGVANLILEYGKKSGSDFVVTRRMRITDVYAKRKGVWIQVASHSSLDSTWQAERAK